jgi:predicted ATPase
VEPSPCLFTDIEGSTKLWEEHPDAMRLALARHDALLQEAISANNGHVFKTMGAAFCAAFATAPDALDAALSAQTALLAEPWQEGLTLRVRMALHTGACQLRDNDYFGPPLNRVARLLAVGHGGQTLLSQSVRELLAPTAPLQDRGLHRLKDLREPEHVWQVVAADLPSDFPVLRSLSLYDNNLPVQVTSFIGREKQIEEIKSLLAKTRLLTLTGSGGCGKTRLSLQVAAEMLEKYPDGIWLVELAPLADPSLVPQTVASVLGVKEEVGKTLTQTLREYLKPKTLLLLLDNCEHLLDACARLTDTVLTHCGHVQMLASSREGLGIAGEQTYRVPSLSLPDPKQTLTPEILSQSEAVQLFLERATLIESTFVLTPQNAGSVGQLCVRLDGIPLALELAAARVRSLSVEEINARLDNRFRLLTGGSRTALPRQQTLRALIDWSYDLLNEQEKALLCRLSVFAGGWTLAAAEAVGAGEVIEDWEVLDLLTSLADKSLVVAEQSEGQTRYRLLETVRQYARDRLRESGEGEAVQERHQAFFVVLAEETEPQLRGPEQQLWLERLETEHDNLRVALEWRGDEASLRLAGALERFWYVRGHFSEGRAWLGSAFSATAGLGRTAMRAKALNGAGALASSQGDYVSTRTLHEEALAIQRELGNRRGIANSLSGLGSVAKDQGDFALARTMYEEALALRRELGDRWGIAYSLESFAALTSVQEQAQRAARLWGAAQALREAIGAPLAPSERIRYDQRLAETRSMMGEVAFAAACSEGRALSMEQAIDYALQDS